MKDFLSEISYILSHFDEFIDKDTGDIKFKSYNPETNTENDQVKFNLQDILKAIGINNFDEFKSNPNKTSTENAQANLQDILKAMGNVGVKVATSSGNFSEKNFSNNVIKADIKETETNFIVYFDVPGVQKENIKLNVDKDNTLVVSIEKFHPSSSDIFHLKERNEGVFTRSLKLPPKIDITTITAKLDLGVLVVKFSKESIITPEFTSIYIE